MTSLSKNLCALSTLFLCNSNDIALKLLVYLYILSLSFLGPTTNLSPFVRFLLLKASANLYPSVLHITYSYYYLVIWSCSICHRQFKWKFEVRGEPGNPIERNPEVCMWFGVFDPPPPIKQSFPFCIWFSRQTSGLVSPLKTPAVIELDAYSFEPLLPLDFLPRNRLLNLDLERRSQSLWLLLIAFIVFVSSSPH